MHVVKDDNDLLREGRLREPEEGTVPMPPDVEVHKRTVQIVKEATDPRDLPMPSDVHAEAHLLALLLWAGAHAPATAVPGMVSDLVGPEQFFSAPHRAIFQAIVSVVDAGKHPDPIAVHSEIVRSKDRANRTSTGVEYLEQLVAKATSVSEKRLREHAETIRDTWVRRQIINAARSLEMSAKSQTGAVALEAARNVVSEVTARVGVKTGGIVSFKDCAKTMMRQFTDGMSGALQTGIETIDDLSGGFFPKEVNVIAARTSVGKSILAMACAEGVVTTQQSEAALYVSLEMPAVAFTRRMAAARAGVDSRKLRRGLPLSTEEWNRLTFVVTELSQKSLYFVDSQLQTCSSISALAMAHAEKLSRKGKHLGMVVIDHIGLVKPEESSGKKSREQQVAEISQWLLHLGDQIGCTVVALAQINREAEGQKGSTMPRLHHIRESGAIEQNANNVWILHRARKPGGVGFVDDPKPVLALAKARDDEPAMRHIGIAPGQSRVYDLEPHEREVQVLA